ncbi:MAG: hydrogenase iron-sulfur subunit [Anaerolineaceae bacterium]|nr:MAG: hydrogenase iron-sulfur subunit [Anaerolineaceae bacterium]
MPGDCHYLEGNTNANRRVPRVKELLQQIGLEPDRVRMFNISSAMAGQFASAAMEMTEQITALGPSPLRRMDHGQDNPRSEFNSN